MKRILSFVIIGVLILLVCLFPNYVNADNSGLFYQPIEDKAELLVDKIALTDIELKIKDKMILYGMLNNYDEEDISYELEIRIFDKNLSIVGDYKSVINIEGFGQKEIVLEIPNESIYEDYSKNDMSFFSLYFKNVSEENELKNLLPSENSLYEHKDYVIDKYDVNIIVNKDNTFDVTEVITVFFNEPNYGIERELLVVNKNVLTKDMITKNRAKITDLSVNEKYTTSFESDYYRIKIGDKKSKVKDYRDYIIKYKYNVGKDLNELFDTFNYNLVGSKWDTVIGNVSFRITFPSMIDMSKIDIVHVSKDSITRDNIIYSTETTSISGRYNNVLGEKEDIVLNVELKEGYFENTQMAIDFISYLVFIIPFLCLSITFIFWCIFKRKKRTVESLEIYPPQGLNSLEVGIIYNKRVKVEDVNSLLILLANEGYLSISPKGKNFKVKKLKDYDGDNLEEKIFFYGLFASKVNNKKIEKIKVLDDAIESVSYEIDEEAVEVSSKDLYDRFNRSLKRILSNLNNRNNKNNFFRKKMFVSIILILLAVISIFSIVGIPIYEYGGYGELFLALLLVLFFLPFYIVGFFSSISVFFRVLWLCLTVVFSCVFLSKTSFIDAILNENILFIGVLFGVCCVIGIIICLKALPKLAGYNDDVSCKIYGFKKFLEISKKKELEKVIVSNPSYFYDMIPYVYVFGIADIWFKKFEKFKIGAPSWYVSDSAFDFREFTNFIDFVEKFMNNIK